MCHHGYCLWCTNNFFCGSAPRETACPEVFLIKNSWMETIDASHLLLSESAEKKGSLSWRPTGSFHCKTWQLYGHRAETPNRSTVRLKELPPLTAERINLKGGISYERAERQGQNAAETENLYNFVHCPAAGRWMDTNMDMLFSRWTFQLHVQVR